MPRRSVMRRSRASSDISASANRSVCKDKAVRGERSSCAASATNRRWVVIDCSTRASRRLIATANGRTSTGRRFYSTGCISCSARWSISSDNAAIGRNILRTRSATIKSSTGTKMRNGIKVRKALSRAISSRTPVSWATAIRAPPVVVLTNTRYCSPLTSSVCNPSERLSGIGRDAWDLPFVLTLLPLTWNCTITRDSSSMSWA